jgi:mannosyltransferase
VDATAPEARGRARLWIAAPVVLSLVTAALAAVGARRSFTLVEAESVLQSGRPWRDLVPVWHVQASDGIYLGLLKGWLHVGSSEWVARAPSIAAAAATAGVVYALGTRLFDRVAGLAAGALFATSAYTAGLGREAQPLAAAMLAVTLSTWLFLVALDSRRRHAWAAYCAVAALSVYVHPSCALVLVAHAAMLFFGRRATPASIRGAVAAAALATPAVAGVLAARRRLIDPLAQPGLGDVARAVHEASGRNVIVLVVAATGLALLVHAAAAGRRADALALLGVWAGVPLAAVLVLSIARPSLDVRYLAVSTPALSLLGGFGLRRAARREVAAAVALASLALSGVRLAQLDRRTLENWPAAVAYATTTKEQGDRIVIAPPRALSAFSYYAGPGRGSLEAGGATAFVIVRGTNDEAALDAARSAVHVPAYALRGEHRFGRHLRVQEWNRTGLEP